MEISHPSTNPFSQAWFWLLMLTIVILIAMIALYELDFGSGWLWIGLILAIIFLFVAIGLYYFAVSNFNHVMLVAKSCGGKVIMPEDEINCCEELNKLNNCPNPCNTNPCNVVPNCNIPNPCNISKPCIIPTNPCNINPCNVTPINQCNSLIEVNPIPRTIMPKVNVLPYNKF